MNPTEKASTYMYSNHDIIEPLIDYINFLYKEIRPYYALTTEEYISMIWSYDFNEGGER